MKRLLLTYYQDITWLKYIFQRSKISEITKRSQSTTTSLVQQSDQRRFQRIEIKDSDEFLHMKEINPEDAELLINHNRTVFSLNGRESKMSLYQTLRNYKTHYKEKKTVGDPIVASKIVECIRNHSDGNIQTPFIDADGVLCLIGRQWAKMCQRPLTIFNRDEKFSVFHKHWFSDNIDIRSVNLASLIIHHLSDEPSLPPLTMETLALRNGWDNESPGYTLFATSTLPLIKFLTYRLSLIHI